MSNRNKYHPMIRRFTTIILLAIMCCMPDVCAQNMIRVGDKVPEWTFQDSEKNEFTMDSWSGKVIQIAYVSPSYADLNDDFNDYLAGVYAEGRLNFATFMGIGIVDCASSKIPNALIRKVAGYIAKKYKTVVLFDNDATLQSLWRLPEDSYSTIIIDKDKICRYVSTGKIEKSEYEGIIKLLENITQQ